MAGSSDDDLEALLGKRHPPNKECRVCWALRSLERDDLRRLFEQVLDSDAPATAVSDAFQRRDWPVGYESVNRHRKRCAA